MKRILYPGVLIATILMGGLLAYAIWKTTPASSKDYLASGKEYFEKQRYPEAIIQFLNSIQKDPRNREARQFLARSFLNQKDLNSAAKQLSATLEYFPDDVDTNLQLGNIHLTWGLSNSNRFRVAAEIAQKILSQHPDNTAALILLGNATAGLQDYRSSVELFEKAISQDPQNSEAFVSLGTTQALQKNYIEAERAFLQARQISPQDKSALIALGNYYRAVRNPVKAESTWKEALSIYPSDKEIYLGAVEFYYQEERLADIDKVLRDVQAKDTKDPAPSLLLAEIYAAKNHPSEGLNLLLDLEKQFPANLDVAAKLAAIFMQDQPDRAQTEIDRILKADTKSPAGYVLLGELQFLSRKYDEAERTLQEAPAIESPYPQTHFFLGSIAARKGRIDQAQDHYLKSLLMNGLYLPSRVGLAEVYFNKGRLADAKQELRRVLNARPGFVAARLLKAAIDTAEKNYAEAEREFTVLLKEQPKNAMVRYYMGLYYDSRGRTADARQNLSQALDLEPNSPQILSSLIQFFMSNKETDRAIQRISEVPVEKRRAFHYELMGLAFFQAGRLTDAEEAYKKALEIEPNRTSARVYLIAVYLRNGHPDESLKKLDDMIKKNPLYADAYGAKGFIYQTQNKLEEAKQSYADALKLDQYLDSAANNYAYILADQGQDLQTALEWALMARRKRQENPDYAGTLGWVQYKLGRYTLARDQLQFAVSKQPDNPEFEYHLALVYKETKQVTEAQAALRKAIRSPQEAKEKILAQQALKEIASLQ